MTKAPILLSLFALTMTSAYATEVIDLWPNGAPNKSTITEAEKVDGKGSIFNVTHARMEVDRPAKPNGKAVILIPGGGYGNLSMEVFEKSFKPSSSPKALRPLRSNIVCLKATPTFRSLTQIKPLKPCVVSLISTV